MLAFSQIQKLPPSQNHDYNLLWTCGQILPEAKVLFPMGPFPRLVSWETGSSSTRCQARSLNHRALKYETTGNQSLTNWYLEGWKCTKRSQLLQRIAIQQLGVFLYLPAWCFSGGWEKGAGVDRPRGETDMNQKLLPPPHSLTWGTVDQGISTLVNTVYGFLWLKDSSFLKWGL